MVKLTRCLLVLTIVALAALSLGAASAPQVIDLIAIDRGWYRQDGQSDDSPPTSPTPSYDVGREGFTGLEYRNWFVFDLSQVPGRIESMTLRTVLAGGSHPLHYQTTGGYRSYHPNELCHFWSVQTSAAKLMSGAGGIAVFQDLGSGSFYGSRFMTESMEGTTVIIGMNSNSVAEANAARDQGVPWAVGGSISTLSVVGVDQFVYAGSHGDPQSNVILRIVVHP